MDATRELTRTDYDGARLTETEFAATNSIEITLGAKGEYRHTIKRYFRPNESRDDVIADIRKIDIKLRTWYGEVRE